MKKSLLVYMFILSSAVYAQDCSKLFISEYVEGWSNNKALEIYNPTASPVNLAEYIVARYSNGNNNAQVKHSVQLSGTVPAYGVFVAVLDKRDPNGMGQEAPVWDSLQARANGFFSADYMVSQAFYWNGDDAIALIKGTLTSDPNQSLSTIPGLQIIDIFGKIGEQPTNPQGTTSPAGGWSTGFPYTGQNGTIVTQDHSMIRRAVVKKGVTNPNISFFDPIAEYDTIPAVIVRLDANGDTVYSSNGSPIMDGNWNSLGSHACACNPATIGEKKVNANFSVFPNPSNGQFTVVGIQGFEKVSLMNTLGQEVKSIVLSNQPSVTFQMDLKGLYIVRLTNASGETVSKKVIVK
jgi:hypothetical protein